MKLMNRNKKIAAIIILMMVFILFAVDKKVFNKELVLKLVIGVWHNVEYFRDEHVMKLIVLKNAPSLLNKNSTDFERLNQIRKWVTEQTLWGNRPVDTTLRLSINNSTALQIYTFLRSTNKALDCGTYSIFLLKIYQLFGYDGYIYDMGNDDQFRHVVVLVWINDNGTRKLIVEDPSYNLTYLDSKNSPLDFFELLRLIKENKTNEIVVKSTTGKGQWVLCHPDEECYTYLKYKVIERRDEGNMVLFRQNFDTQLIKDNLKSFLYCRYLYYAQKIKVIDPILRPIEIEKLKKKLRLIIEVNPGMTP